MTTNNITTGTHVRAIAAIILLSITYIGTMVIDDPQFYHIRHLLYIPLLVGSLLAFTFQRQCYERIDFTILIVLMCIQSLTRLLDEITIVHNAMRMLPVNLLPFLYIYISIFINYYHLLTERANGISFINNCLWSAFAKDPPPIQIALEHIPSSTVESMLKEGGFERYARDNIWIKIIPADAKSRQAHRDANNLIRRIINTIRSEKNSKTSI